MPDMIGYLFTHAMWNEPTTLGTLQLLDTRKTKLSQNVLRRFSVPEEWFSKLATHGELLGYLSADLCIELGITQNIPVIHVASYDAAAAVAAVPAESEDFIFVLPGPWSIIGTELKKPLISEEAFEGGFSNTPGALNTVLFTKSIAGRYILQQLKQEYEAAEGKPAAWEHIIKMVKEYKGNCPYFDPNHCLLFDPKELKSALLKSIGCINDDWAGLFQSAFYSIANNSARSFKTLESVTGKKYKTIYTFGQGPVAVYLSQIFADLSGEKVVFVAPDSAVYGNIGLQLKYFNPSFTLSDIRSVIRASRETKTLTPNKY